MKTIIFSTLLCFAGVFHSCGTAQITTQNMSLPTIKTSIGDIAYSIQKVEGTIPIVFLHGVYYDHRLWDYFVDSIHDRTTIAIDMPLHGQSKKITKKNWQMQDCADMLLEILDSLQIDSCYAVGHSWGSMTILRAVHQQPKRFISVGFCNMPYEAGSFGAKMQFGFQHSALMFRSFYTNQVAKAMMSEESRTQHPEAVQYLKNSLNQLTNKEIRKTDKAVITTVKSGQPYLDMLQVPALALKGKDDYVPTPPNIKTTIVDGKHTSPLEQPQAVLKFIQEVINNK